MNACLRHALVPGFILFFTSCATGPDYKRPEVELPTSKSAEAKEIAAEWWKAFGDPQLPVLVEEALHYNQDLALALARLDEARALAGVAKSAYFPTLDLGAQFGESQLSQVGSTPLLGSARTVKTNQVGIVANYELDLWGKLRRSNEAARARLLEADYNRLNVQLQITSQVATSYIRLRALDAQLQISRKTYQSRIDSNDLINKRFKGGVASELDARQAEAEMWQTKAQVSTYEEAVVRLESSLMVLLGRSPKAIIESPLARGKNLTELMAPPSLPEHLPSQMLERRPDILAAEQALVAENARIGVAKSYYFPSISLFGGIGTDARDIDNLFKGNAGTWNYGVSLFMPIFTAGRTGYLVEATTAQQKQALTSYQKSIQIAFTEVRDATVSFQKQGDLVTSRNAEVFALERNVYLANLRYRNGQSPYLEVLDAERRLFVSELNKVSAQEGLLVSVIDMYKALGGGWASSTKEQNVSSQ
jgi:multidrug efflux system outer membrane protein